MLLRKVDNLLFPAQQIQSDSPTMRFERVGSRFAGSQQPLLRSVPVMERPDTTFRLYSAC